MKEISDTDFSRIMRYANGTMGLSEKEQFEKEILLNPAWTEEINTWRLVFSANRAEYFEKVKNRTDLTDYDNPLDREVLSQFGSFVELEKEPVAKRLPMIPLWTRYQRQLVMLLVVIIAGFGIWYKVELDRKAAMEQAHLEEVRRQKERELAQFKELKLAEQNKKDSLANLTPVKDLVAATQFADVFIAEMINLQNIPQALQGKALGVSTDSDRKGAIQALNAMVNPGRDTTGGILYGAPLKPDVVSAQYARLLLGIGYLKEAKYKEALNTLNAVNEKALIQDVYWYKSLTYIQLKQFSQAKSELLKISDHRYLDDAKNLLEKL